MHKDFISYCLHHWDINWLLAGLIFCADDDANIINRINVCGEIALTREICGYSRNSFAERQKLANVHNFFSALWANQKVKWEREHKSTPWFHRCDLHKILYFIFWSTRTKWEIIKHLFMDILVSFTILFILWGMYGTIQLYGRLVALFIFMAQK